MPYRNCMTFRQQPVVNQVIGIVIYKKMTLKRVISSYRESFIIILGIYTHWMFDLFCHQDLCIKCTGHSDTEF